MMSNSASRTGAPSCLHDLGARTVADDLAAVFQRLDAAHVDAHARIELERAAAGRDLGVAVHDADLFAQLVDENDDGVRFADRAGQLAQRLRHKARVQTDKAVAHLALDLRARHERRDGVDHDDVDRAGAHERLGDLKRLLAGVRLGDEHILDLDAKRAGIGDVERVLGVDERDLAARLLRLGGAHAAPASSYRRIQARKFR